jgi:hypothetical protein
MLYSLTSHTYRLAVLGTPCDTSRYGKCKTLGGAVTRDNRPTRARPAHDHRDAPTFRPARHPQPRPCLPRQSTPKGTVSSNSTSEFSTCLTVSSPGCQAPTQAHPVSRSDRDSAPTGPTSHAPAGPTSRAPTFHFARAHRSDFARTHRPTRAHPPSTSPAAIRDVHRPAPRGPAAVCDPPEEGEHLA